LLSALQEDPTGKTVREAADRIRKVFLRLLGVLSKGGKVHYDEGGMPVFEPGGSLGKRRIERAVMEAHDDLEDIRCTEAGQGIAEKEADN
jgi:hypothetical protein